MKVQFGILKNGEWFADSEKIEMDNIPRVGELVCIEGFFPESIDESWEEKETIPPFMIVYQVVWWGNDKVDINLTIQEE